MSCASASIVALTPHTSLHAGAHQEATWTLTLPSGTMHLEAHVAFGVAAFSASAAAGTRHRRLTLLWASLLLGIADSRRATGKNCALHQLVAIQGFPSEARLWQEATGHTKACWVNLHFLQSAGKVSTAKLCSNTSSMALHPPYSLNKFESKYCLWHHALHQHAH